MFKLFRRRPKFDDTKKAQFIEAISGMLKVQTSVAAKRVPEDGHINRRAMGYIYGFILLLLCGLCAAFDASAADNTAVTGRWELTTTSPSGSYVAGIDLAADQDKYEGKSGPLIPDWDFFFYKGTREKNGVHLKVTYEGGSEIGDLTVRNDGGSLKGSGTIHGIAVIVRGQRPLKRPPDAPTVHDFEPKTFWSTFSGATDVPPPSVAD